MRYAVIPLHPRSVTVESCETCGLTHDHEETACAAARGAQAGECGTHCACWWEGDGCCRCGDDPCRAAACALG